MGAWEGLIAAADTGAALYKQKAKDARDDARYQARLDESRAYQEKIKEQDRLLQLSYAEAKRVAVEKLKIDNYLKYGGHQNVKDENSAIENAAQEFFAKDFKTWKEGYDPDGMDATTPAQLVPKDFKGYLESKNKLKSAVRDGTRQLVRKGYDISHSKVAQLILEGEQLPKVGRKELGKAHQESSKLLAGIEKKLRGYGVKGEDGRKPADPKFQDEVTKLLELKGRALRLYEGTTGMRFEYNLNSSWK